MDTFRFRGKHWGTNQNLMIPTNLVHIVVEPGRRTWDGNIKTNHWEIEKFNIPTNFAADNCLCFSRKKNKMTALARSIDLKSHVATMFEFPEVMDKAKSLRKTGKRDVSQKKVDLCCQVWIIIVCVCVCVFFLPYPHSCVVVPLLFIFLFIATCTHVILVIFFLLFLFLMCVCVGVRMGFQRYLSAGSL